MAARSPRLAVLALEDRRTPAGLLDPTFGGGDGTTELGNLANYYSADSRCVAVQPDGKIVAAGVIDSPTGKQGLVFRLNVDGGLDTSFSNDGYFITQFGGRQTYLQGIAVQPDGKIVVAGSTVSGSAIALAARFNPDGTLDNTF